MLFFPSSVPAVPNGFSLMIVSKFDAWIHVLGFMFFESISLRSFLSFVMVGLIILWH